MTEYAYTQNDNEIKIQFQKEGAAEDLSAATKIELQFFIAKRGPLNRVDPAGTFNTVDDASIFDITDISNGNLIFKPVTASFSSLTEQKYFGRFVVYTAEYPNGVVWCNGSTDLFEFFIAR